MCKPGGIGLARPRVWYNGTTCYAKAKQNVAHWFCIARVVSAASACQPRTYRNVNADTPHVLMQKLQCTLLCSYKRPPNAALRLLGRELASSPCGSAVHTARAFSECILPTDKLQEIESPDAHVGRFTPDGNHLVCFSLQLQAVMLFAYLGPAPVQHPNPDEPVGFNRFFIERWRLNLCSGSEVLNRDFCLSLRDGAFLLLASSVPCRRDGAAGAAAASPTAAAAAQQAAIAQQQLDSQQTDMEQTSSQASAAFAVSVTTNRRPPSSDCCEVTTFHVVDLQRCMKVDERRYIMDFFDLTGNACASLYDNVLALTSIRTQTVHLMQVNGDGTLRYMQSIGKFCQADDALPIQLAASAEQQWQLQKQQKHHAQQQRRLELAQQHNLGLQQSSHQQLQQSSHYSKAARTINSSPHRGHQSAVGGAAGGGAAAGGQHLWWQQQQPAANGVHHLSQQVNDVNQDSIRPSSASSVSTDDSIDSQNDITDSDSEVERRERRRRQPAINQPMLQQEQQQQQPSRGGTFQLLHPPYVQQHMQHGQLLRIREHVPRVSSVQAQTAGAAAANAAAAAALLDPGGQLIVGLQQRLLAFLYKAIIINNPWDVAPSLWDFQYNFDVISGLVLWRARLLDRQHLLLKLGAPTHGTAAKAEIDLNRVHFFAVYDMLSTCFKGFWKAADTQLLGNISAQPQQLLVAGPGMSPWDRCAAAALYPAGYPVGLSQPEHHQQQQQQGGEQQHLQQQQHMVLQVVQAAGRSAGLQGQVVVRTARSPRSPRNQQQQRFQHQQQQQQQSRQQYQQLGAGQAERTNMADSSVALRQAVDAVAVDFHQVPPAQAVNTAGSAIALCNRSSGTTSTSSSKAARERLKLLRQVVLMVMPGIQNLSSSPYLDPRLFRYSKHISPVIGLRNSPREPLVFKHARQYPELCSAGIIQEQAKQSPRMQQGTDGAAQGGLEQQQAMGQQQGPLLQLEPAQPQSVTWGNEEVPRRQLHLFHPTDPFILTVVQTIAQPAVISICYRS